MTVHVLRVAADGRRWWILSDGEHTIKGKPGESKAALLNLWRQRHGPITKLIRYIGVHRVSEAVMTLVSIAEERKNVTP